MALTFMWVTETDPEDSVQYLDICAFINGILCGVGYSRPLHLTTTVSTGGAASGQAVIPLDDIGELYNGRKINLAGILHEILSVDSVASTITLTANLASALAAAASATTNNASVESEILDDLTQRGYTWT